MNKLYWQPIETSPLGEECYLRAKVSILSYSEAKYEMYGPCLKEKCLDGMYRWFKLDGEKFDFFIPTEWTTL